jgi:type II secretory pathway pseudopilin PulG
MLRRVSGDGGFGLVELLIALTVMALGISAIAAGFTSGIVALNRASQIGTAGTIADRQMEAFRALSFDRIALKASSVPSPQGTATADTVYTGDAALAGTDTHTGTHVLTDSYLSTNSAAYNPNALGAGTAYCSGAIGSFPSTCAGKQTGVVGPDGRSYRVDTFIVWYCATATLTDGATPTCSGAEAVKQVTVVVRDNGTPSKTYYRETTTFDQAT